jgi:hypothetical protein
MLKQRFSNALAKQKHPEKQTKKQKQKADKKHNAKSTRKAGNEKRK